VLIDVVLDLCERTVHHPPLTGRTVNRKPDTLAGSVAKVLVPPAGTEPCVPEHAQTMNGRRTPPSRCPTHDHAPALSPCACSCPLALPVRDANSWRGTNWSGIGLRDPSLQLKEFPRGLSRSSLAWSGVMLTRP